MIKSFVNLALMEESENRILKAPMKDFVVSGKRQPKAVI